MTTLLVILIGMCWSLVLVAAVTYRREAIQLRRIVMHMHRQLDSRERRIDQLSARAVDKLAEKVRWS